MLRSHFNHHHLCVTRRQFLRTTTAVVGGVLAGCTDSGGVPGARVTLTQWYHQYGEAGTQEAVLRYAAEYTRRYPDIAIKVVWVPGDYGTKLSTALLTAGGPDIFEDALTFPMVGASQVVPLDDLFTPEIRREFSAPDLAANTVGGKIYGVRMIDDTGLLYYRKSLLQAAGIEPPTTMDALISAAKRLSSGDRKGLFVGNDGGISALLTLAPWSAGSEFLSDNRIVFDTPRTAAAYERVRELIASGALLIGAPTDWADPSALIQGLTAMQWGGLWSYPAIYKALGDDVGVVPWPELDDQGAPVTFAGGWSQMINAQSRHIDEAKRFVRWMWLENGALAQDWALSYGFHVPPRQSIARNAAPLQSGVPAQAVRIVQQHGRLLPPIWNSAMTTALSDALTNIIQKGRPAAPEVAAAARKCERELERSLE